MSNRITPTSVVAGLVMGCAAIGGYYMMKSSPAYTTESRSIQVQQAYAVARLRPDLLAQLPCSCGCMAAKKSHGSNLDCFKTTHGETCPICVMTALSAERLTKEGRTIAEIKRYLTNVNGFDVSGGSETTPAAGEIR